MTAVTLEQVTKVYPNGFKAVDELDLSINVGELMVLVGPSGCGKTTVLRMVAGLEEITSGTLQINGRVVNDVSPKDRDIAMVFQNYALYPHMTVARNLGFALKLRGLRKREVTRQVIPVAKLLGLTDLLDKRPAQLSGGQRQRVAMGRAIVREPALFLMDEPLSNLDAKLRVQMRAEISRLQRHLGVATLFVTHDQTEAMTLGDRIAIMRDGVLQQLDTPQAVYDAPLNLFVAEFIGSPAMNLYEGHLSEDQLHLGRQTIALPTTVFEERPRLERYDRVVVGIRPEHLKIPSGEDNSSLVGEVNLVEALGSDAIVHFTIDAPRVHTEAAVSGPATGDEIELAAGELAVAGEGVARVEPAAFAVGEKVRFLLDPRQLYFFDPSTGLAI
jgi:multiple sugar transport system ATP-binding protein